MYIYIYVYVYITVYITIIVVNAFTELFRGSEFDPLHGGASLQQPAAGPLTLCEGRSLVKPMKYHEILMISLVNVTHDIQISSDTQILMISVEKKRLLVHATCTMKPRGIWRYCISQPWNLADLLPCLNPRQASYNDKCIMLTQGISHLPSIVI